MEGESQEKQIDGADVFRPNANVRWLIPLGVSPTAVPHGIANGQHGESSVQQESFPVFLDDTEQAISEQSVVRFIGWLRTEIERIPEWHPLRHEYRQQLRILTGRQRLGPSMIA